MLVLKLELWPYGQEDRARELGRLWIANTGGTDEVGEYETAITDEGCTVSPWSPYVGGPPERSGKVKNYPRLTAPVWSLVLRALKGMGY